MLQTLIEARAVLSLVVAVVVGTAGLQTHPLDTDNVFLAIIQLRTPDVFHVMVYGYALLWFSTPLTAMSLLVSLFVLVANRRQPTVRFEPLPAYPAVADRAEPSLVIGETHHKTRPDRAPNPTVAHHSAARSVRRRARRRRHRGGQDDGGDVPVRATAPHVAR